MGCLVAFRREVMARAERDVLRIAAWLRIAKMEGAGVVLPARSTPRDLSEGTKADNEREMWRAFSLGESRSTEVGAMLLVALLRRRPRQAVAALVGLLCSEQHPLGYMQLWRVLCVVEVRSNKRHKDGCERCSPLKVLQGTQETPPSKSSLKLGRYIVKETTQGTPRPRS